MLWSSMLISHQKLRHRLILSNHLHVCTQLARYCVLLVANYYSIAKSSIVVSSSYIFKFNKFIEKMYKYLYALKFISWYI